MSLDVQPIRIGYYDPYDVYAKLGTDLKSKVNLTNLHWRKSEKESLRSIPQLQTTFIEETPKNFDNNADGPSLKISDTSNVEALERTIRLLNTPYVRLMLIESDDIDSYKSKIRPLIREWLKSNVDGSNGPLDWYLIFYHSNDNDKNRTRVFEKLKVDFNPPERDIDRCIRLKEKYTNQLEENESWNLLNNKLKSSILHSFSSRLQQLSAAVNTLNNNNGDDPSSSSSTFLKLALTEGLSRQFFQLRLFEDALTEYDYLSQTITPLEKNKDLFPEETFDFAKEPITNLLKFASIPSLFETQDQSVTLFRLRSYVFSKQFLILNALSQAAPSLSIASIHVSEFLRRLHLFIHDILKLYTKDGITDPQVSEWAYTLIDEVLQLDLCSKINTFTSDQSDENISQVSERFGELLLVQRSQFVKLGTLLGFHIGEVMNEISIDDNDNEHKASFTLQHQELKTLFESQEIFEEHFITITSEAIRHFSISGRPRAVDALSIDIALVDYHNKNYEKAVEVLSTCPEFYQSQGWDLISNNLQEIYADCLENLNEDADFFQSPKNEDGDDQQAVSISKKTSLSKLYLDITSSYKLNSGRQLYEPKNVKSSFEKMEKIIPDENLIYPADNLFDISPKPFLKGDFDRYEINIDFRSPFETELKLQNSRILLKNSNDEVFKFEKSDIILQKGITTIEFQSNDIIIGEFKFFKFITNFNNFTLVHEFDENDEQNSEPFLITSLGNLSLKIENPTNINLTKKSISLFISTQFGSVDSTEIRLWSRTEGFEPTSDIKIMNLLEEYELSNDDSDEGYQVSLKDDNNSDDVLTIRTGYLRDFTDYEIIIPYINNSARNSNILDLKAQISFIDCNMESKSQTVTKILDTSCSIAVSVQDIFKKNGLFAKFSIGTADIEFPIRILSCSLQGNDKYKVSSSMKSSSFIAFGEQPGSYFFKIEKNDDVHYDSNDFLTLDITYRDLKKELKEILFEKFIEESNRIKSGCDNPLNEYMTFIKLIIEGLKFDFNSYILDQEIKIINFNKIDKKIINSVSPNERIKFYKLLEERLLDSNYLKIEKPFEEYVYVQCNKHLYIDVQIPSVHVIHTVELNLEPKTHYIIGDSIETNLNLKSLINKVSETSDPNQTSKKKVQFQTSSIKTFQLEILSNQDNWLINGKTKFKFNISDKDLEKINEFQLYLIPLKIGKLALPKIKIINDSDKDEYLMEIDYQNENETINVVSDMINK
ncbi:Transport protein particle [Wickerhamomyces ciferrii]|uniref:Transport protein particle n=1 Tax=Wickerhamomyces ciferrii (strain ATCC 14091 / BCRC 22168 / CBS 111 / JCM 3599 / NBRC 0793 / NRRL Y-1031 F-60-10) TaxID=1206466 RepID=K0KU58_WICCF|nr:Transport protein particle [Wickerhamomyces ciferrii]CCH44748.1 Transport protein particle [Wickerhamomyces ciferrii]